MRIMKDRIILIIIISTLVFTFGTAGFAVQGSITSQPGKNIISSVQSFEINAEIMKKNTSLYQNLSEEQKAAIKEKMTKMSQQRQKEIAAIAKQIEEYKQLKIKPKQTKSQESRISQLKVLQQYALKQNAPDTAKKLEKIIGLYKNLQLQSSLD